MNYFVVVLSIGCNCLACLPFSPRPHLGKPLPTRFTLSSYFDGLYLPALILKVHLIVGPFFFYLQSCRTETRAKVDLNHCQY